MCHNGALLPDDKDEFVIGCQKGNSFGDSIAWPQCQTSLTCNSMSLPIITSSQNPDMEGHVDIMVPGYQLGVCYGREVITFQDPEIGPMDIVVSEKAIEDDGTFVSTISITVGPTEVDELVIDLILSAPVEVDTEVTGKVSHTC